MIYDIVLFTGTVPPFWQRTMGAYQLAHFLRTQGYSVRVIDNVSLMSAEDMKQIADLYITASTLAVGISTTFMSDSSFNNDSPGDAYNVVIPAVLADTLKYVKLTHPNVKIVAGGARSQDAESLPFVDTVIHGYGEDKFLDYINLIKGGGNLPTSVSSDPAVRHFNIQQLQHRFHSDDSILPGETLPIEISRGCIFKCKFCAFPLNGKSKLDFIRDASFIIDEIKYNYEHFGTVNYHLTDDTFNDSTLKVETIANEIAKLPFKINFATYLRLDLLAAHREQIPMLQEMGLTSPHFGIESLNQLSATSIGKGMNVEKVKLFLDELYFDLWKEKIPFLCSFIIGLPHETPETVENTFQWVKTRPHLNAHFFPLSLAKSFFMSEFQINYLQYGYIITDMKSGKWKNKHFTFDSAFELYSRYNKELLHNSGPAAFRMMNLLNHGYTVEEAKKTKWGSLSRQKLIDTSSDKLRDYKSLILQSN